MAIESKDINLQKFLETSTPQFISEPGKIILDNASFVQIASLLKIDASLMSLAQRIGR